MIDQNLSYLCSSIFDFKLSKNVLLMLFLPPFEKDLVEGNSVPVLKYLNIVARFSSNHDFARLYSSLVTFS